MTENPPKSSTLITEENERMAAADFAHDYQVTRKAAGVPLPASWSDPWVMAMVKRDSFMESLR